MPTAFFSTDDRIGRLSYFLWLLAINTATTIAGFISGHAASSPREGALMRPYLGPQPAPHFSPMEVALFAVAISSLLVAWIS